MLMLLKPWRNLADLKDGFNTWEEALTDFSTNTHEHDRQVMSNIQFYYACKKAAMDEDDEIATDEIERDMGGDEDEEEGEEGETMDVISLEGLVKERKGEKVEERVYGEEAIECGIRGGMFSADDATDDWVVTAKTRNLERFDQHHATLLENWKAESDGHHEQSPQPPSEQRHRPVPPSVYPQIRLPILGYNEQPPTNDDNSVQYFRLPDVEALKADQLRAFDIFAKHLHKRMSGEQPPPLRMKIVGVAGTGKSTVLEKIQELCDLNGVGHTLAKGAYTANAARRIGGDTLHALGGMTTRIYDIPKGERLRHLQEFWIDKTVLAIDEFSMVFKTFAALFSRNLALAKGFDIKNWEKANDMFGSLDVILVGDLHQIPPVARGHIECLFTPEDIQEHSVLQITGRRIYQSFQTTVILKEQVSTN
jgi:hypothetical protein